MLRYSQVKKYYAMKRLFVMIVLFFITSQLNAQQATAPAKVIMDTVYTIADTPPAYPGGNDAWNKYLKKNLKYPKKAWWEELESDVVVEFIVRKDGSITDIKHLTVFGWGFEEEAVRLIKASGKWNPALKNGRAVDFKGTVKIPFRLRTSKGEKD